MPKPVKSPPTPDRVRVYDAEGNASDKFPIDAREAVASGSYTYEPPAEVEAEAVEAEAPEPSAKPSDAMTKAELLELAKERGVGVTASNTKAEILAALEEGDET